MKSFPFLSFYTAGPDFISDFDGLPEKRKSEIREKIAATNELRGRFKKEVPKLAEAMAARVSKKSESD